MRVLLALALLTLTLDASATVILDEFDGPAGGQSVMTVDDAGDVSDTVSGTGAVGDVRRLALLGLGLPSSDAVSLAEVNTLSSPGAFHFSTSDAVSHGRAFIDYEGGFTLDLSGENAVVFKGVSVSSLSFLNLSLNALLQGGGEVSSGYAIELQAGFSGDVSFDLSRFEGDLSRVTGIHVIVDVFAPPSGDVQVDRLVAIPESTTGCMIGVGLAAAALSRGRRHTSRH